MSPHPRFVGISIILGGFGKQGYGYNVKYLYEEIGKILGLNQQHNIIVIGAGNLGQALANYVKFEKLGFMIIGLFDVNPALDGVTVRGIKIRMLDELEDFCRENKVDIAALTMPKEKSGRHCQPSGRSWHSCDLEFCTCGSGIDR